MPTYEIDTSDEDISDGHWRSVAGMHDLFRMDTPRVEMGDGCSTCTGETVATFVTKELALKVAKLLNKEENPDPPQVPKPDRPGHYWVKPDGSKEFSLINIWGYTGWKYGDKLFTSWDGGCGIDDEIFIRAKWYGPVEMPKPPKE